MSDEIDRFTSRDVIEVLAVSSRLGLARGFLLRRICTLAFENLTQFTPRQLARMAYSLAKLRFLARHMADDILDNLRPNFGRLGVSMISEVLFSLAMINSRHQQEDVRRLIELYIDCLDDKKTLTSLADFS